MGWRVEPLGAEGYLHVIADGAISTEEVMLQVQQGIAQIVARALPGALIDYSDAILEMSVVDIYKMPDWFEAAALPRGTRIAVVLPADPVNMHKYTFFDDVATNRGYQVHLFWEFSRARDWLQGGTV